MFRFGCFYDKREVDKIVASFNPWRRRPENYGLIQYSILENGARQAFEHYETNLDLDVETKHIALKLSPSVVSISTYSGENQIILGSGTIIESSTNIDESWTGIILTSASLFREDPTKDQLATNLKVEVHLEDGSLYWGNLLVHDFHYNIAMVTIDTRSELQVAQWRCIRDVPDHTSSKVNVHSHTLRAHSGLCKISPGDKIVALARLFCNKYSIMAAPGRYSSTACELDCQELLTANCKITKCGIGGPIVNSNGNVIGMAFYGELSTPFLPINIFANWWEYYKVHKNICRPSIGLKVTSLHTAPICTLEWIPGKDFVDGVTVEEVKSGSLCGLDVGDIIFQCSGQVVSSILEFLEIVWDNFGKSTEVMVLKRDKSTPMRISINVQDTRPEDFYSWPLPPEYRKVCCKRPSHPKPRRVGRVRKSLRHKDYRGRK